MSSVSQGFSFLCVEGILALLRVEDDPGCVIDEVDEFLEAQKSRPP